jgi:putative membrane protein
MLRQAMFESFAGFDDFLVYLGVSLAYLAVFVAIYIRITPYRELQLIREGNMAASFSLSGAILGFIVPLASAIQHSVNLVDMAVWGLVAMIVQILAFVVVKLCIPSVTRDIPENKGSAGFFLGSLSLGVGLLNAACMSF